MDFEDIMLSEMSDRESQILYDIIWGIYKSQIHKNRKQNNIYQGWGMGETG